MSAIFKNPQKCSAFFSLKNFSKSIFVFTFTLHVVSQKKKSHCSEIGRHKSIFTSSDEQLKAENILKRQAILSQTIV